MRYFYLCLFITFYSSAIAGDEVAVGITKLELECDEKSAVVCAGTSEEIENCTKKKAEAELKCRGLKAFRSAGYFGKASFIPMQGQFAGASNPSNASGAQPSGGQQATSGCVGSEYAADYSACKNVVNQINSSVLLEQALATRNSIKLREVQTSLANRVQASNGDSQVAIKAQIDELDERIKQNNLVAGFYGVKAAKLGDLLGKWPTTRNLERKLAPCSKSKEAIEQCDEGVESLISSHGRELTPNLNFRNVISQTIQQVALQATQVLVENKTLKNNKKLLEEQLGIVAKNSEDTNEFLTTYCQSEQGRADTEKCGIYGVNPNYNTAGLGGFGDDPEWGAANIGDTSGQGITGSFDPNNTATGEGQDSIRDGLLDFDNEKSSGAFIDNPTAASLGQGQGGAGGGGAGAGGGAGGGAGPGLSAKPNQPGDKDLASLTEVKSDGAYGKTKGSFYKKAKRGKNSRRDDDESSNKGLSQLGLFGKSAVEEAPVGPQNIALFDLISERYEKVKEQGRVKK